MGKPALAVVLALLFCGAANAQSDDCTRITGFTLPLTPVEEGYLVPIGINGTPRQFLFEFSAAYTTLDAAVVAELNLHTKPMPVGMQVKDSTGRFTAIAVVPALSIGPLTGKNAEMVFAEHRPGWGAAVGTTGANIFNGFDLELDLAHNGFGMYQPRENCAFTPFWPAAEWGEDDLVKAPTGGIYSPMMLDGKKLIVTFNTTDQKSYMPFETAHSLFGISEDDPRLVPAGHGEGGTALYRFAFATLSGGDNVTVKNPEIYIRAGEKTCGGIRDLEAWKWQEHHRVCFGSGDLRLGINLLKKLHFYFDTKHKKVYFTLAEPPEKK